MILNALSYRSGLRAEQQHELLVTCSNAILYKWNFSPDAIIRIQVPSFFFIQLFLIFNRSYLIATLYLYTDCLFGWTFFCGESSLHSKNLRKLSATFEFHSRIGTSCIGILECPVKLQNHQQTPAPRLRNHFQFLGLDSGQQKSKTLLPFLT